jgi:hypothetical protein
MTPDRVRLASSAARARPKPVILTRSTPFSSRMLAGLVLRGKQLESGKPADRTAIQLALRHWQQGTGLAGIRDAADLSTNEHYVQELATASGSGFARNHNHMIGLGIQRTGFAAGFGFHGVF